MTLSLNALAAPLAASLCADAERLRLKVSGGQDAPVLVDAGIDCLGGIEAGRRIAEICLGGLGRVRVEASGDGWPLRNASTKALASTRKASEKRAKKSGSPCRCCMFPDSAIRAGAAMSLPASIPPKVPLAHSVAS